MKKDRKLQKVLAISFFVLSFIFVLLDLLFIFNGNFTIEDMQNRLVRIIVIVLSVVFFIVGIGMIIEAFWNKEALSSIILYSDRASSVKVTNSVIKNIVKKNAALIEGVKTRGETLYLDENGGVRMTVNVTVKNNDVDYAVDRLRCLLFDAFYEILGVEFTKIDFRVTALQPKYVPDMKKVDLEAEEMKEKREKLAEAKKLLEEEEQQAAEERLAEENARREREKKERLEREESRRAEKIASIEDEVASENETSVEEDASRENETPEETETDSETDEGKSENSFESDSEAEAVEEGEMIAVEDAVPTAEMVTATSDETDETPVVEVPQDAVIDANQFTSYSPELQDENAEEEAEEVEEKTVDAYEQTEQKNTDEE